MNKELAERLIELTYANRKYVGPLCLSIPHPLSADFAKWWSRANTRRHQTIRSYFNHDYWYEEVSILRLITLHHFIRETYK